MLLDPEVPQPPLAARELEILDFEVKRIASPEITEAVKLAQESRTAWQDAVRAHFEAVQHNALHKLAGSGNQITGGREMPALFERHDTAAAAAHEADAALITALTAETVVTI